MERTARPNKKQKTRCLLALHPANVRTQRFHFQRTTKLPKPPKPESQPKKERSFLRVFQRRIDREEEDQFFIVT